MRLSRQIVAAVFVATGVAALILGGLGIFQFATAAPNAQSSDIMRNAAMTHLAQNPISRRTISIDDVLQLATDLQNKHAKVRDQAILRIRMLAKTDGKSIGIGLAFWVSPLISAKRYADLERLSLRAILDRPDDSTIVRIAQRARVLAFIAQGEYARALPEAKKYYDVASLAQTPEAIDLLSRILAKTSGSLIANAFRAEQMESSDDSAILASIKINSAPYAKAMARLQDGPRHSTNPSYRLLMARGNLLLLSGCAVKATGCFQAACRLAKGAGADLRQALEATADSLRAQRGNVAPADDFLRTLRTNPAEEGACLADRGSTTVEDVRLAAEEIAPCTIVTSAIPALERQRIRQEGVDGVRSAPPQIVSGFEGSTPVYVTTLSPTHLVVEITTPGYRDWFMFQVKGIAGRIIRIDITGAYKTVPNWAQKNWSLNPVFSYAANLSNPATYVTTADTGGVAASNGAFIPNTEGQTWHYVSDVWSDAYTLSFVQRFTADAAYIAMRVPREPDYNERFFGQLASNPVVTLVKIGSSVKNRPLLMAKIGTLGNDKPCVLLYAGEHADEQDAGWVAQGAIEYLSGNSPEAGRLRQRLTYLVIPMLDPDASATGTHQGIISSFLPGRITPESIAYANWFERWVDTGHRLDLVVDLHNIQSGEGPHVFCPLLEGFGARGAFSLALHRLIAMNGLEAGYDFDAQPHMRGWLPDRLSGWLSQCYGPLAIAYEVNSQAPARHLSLLETKRLGRIFVDSIGQFFATPDGIAALANVDERRQERLARMAGRVPPSRSINAIDFEASALRIATLGSNTDLMKDAIAVP